MSNTAGQDLAPGDLDWKTLCWDGHVHTAQLPACPSLRHWLWEQGLGVLVHEVQELLAKDRGDAPPLFNSVYFFLGDGRRAPDSENPGFLNPGLCSPQQCWDPRYTATIPGMLG